MQFLLDTSACIAHLRGRSPALTARLAAEASRCGLCSVVVSELVYGAHRAADPVAEGAKVQRFTRAFASLPFDDAAAERAANVRAALAAAGTPIGRTTS